jgi:predicted flap endonuclease-1-like 5' DNA nuclease
LGRHLDALLASQSSLSWNPLVSIALCSLFMTGVTAFAWAIFACLGFIVAVLIGSTGTGAVVVHFARSSGRQSNGARRTDANAPAPTEEPGIQIEAPVDGESPAEAASLTAAGGATSEEVDDTRSEAEMAASAGPTPKEAPPEDSPLQAEADALTRMAGIGPTYAMRLRDGGITTFAQLAELEVGKIAAVLGWSTARVERERLRERAADLAATQ